MRLFFEKVSRKGLAFFAFQGTNNHARQTRERVLCRKKARRTRHEYPLRHKAVFGIDPSVKPQGDGVPQVGGMSRRKRMLHIRAFVVNNHAVGIGAAEKSRNFPAWNAPPFSLTRA